MKAVLPNLLGAAAGLAALEIAWVTSHANGLFLSFAERGLYAVACLGLSTFCVLTLGSAMWAMRGVRWLRALAAASVFALSARAAWLLTSGRRVHDLPGRPYAVVGLAVLVALFAYVALRWLPRAYPRWIVSLGATPVIVALLLADVLILARGYPAFHLALAISAVFSAAYAALLCEPAPSRRAPWIALALIAAGVGATIRLAAHPTAGFAVREKAPWTARFTRLLEPERVAKTTAVQTTVVARGGVDLRDRDILLITVDALRADLLAAYGGRGVTPVLDKLANESARFMHAYTPAPHTSYALASLLTGKFVKPLVELGHQLGNPNTLPDRLRRYGYRTAAFYPPAIFFVDGASFAALAERGFGFEYRKEMFASADARVGQLQDYLHEADPKRPLFVWVHLFEPHEPYDPPADITNDGSERGRYEAEVRAADRAIENLIATFRAAKPNATVIVTADHGEEFGDHGGSFHGSSLYDEQVHVPLLWSSPGVVSPRQIDTPVELTDVGTTILSTAGVPRDAHMRGDDLSAVLRGEPGPQFAFASIDARHMASDGTYKLICGARDLHCALFDLHHDPSELHNVPDSPRADVLRAQLDGFLASITRNEAVAVSAGVGLPEALARAKLGAAVPIAELLPSLTDARASVRAEAARVLATIGDPRALPALESARSDDDAEVRDEAAIASLYLGNEAAHEHVLRVQGPAARRAAFALARTKDTRALPALSSLIADESASEEERLRALRALADLGIGVEPAIQALKTVRLREEAARTLGKLGGPQALAALHAQLAEERYPPSRWVEAEALLALNDPQLLPLVRHFMGMQSAMPHGVELMRTLKAADDAPQLRDGHYMPKLPHIAGPVRVTLWFDAPLATTLRIDGRSYALQPNDPQLSFVRESAKAARKIAIEGQVTLRASVIVPAVPEIPPPAPEPWDASMPAR